MRFSWKTERFFVMSDVSQKVAQILLQTEAIQVYREKPFVFVSGRISPVYIDCRKLLSFADERSEERRVGKECRSRWSPYDEKKKAWESSASGPSRTRHRARRCRADEGSRSARLQPRRTDHPRSPCPRASRWPLTPPWRNIAYPR